MILLQHFAYLLEHCLFLLALLGRKRKYIKSKMTAKLKWKITSIAAVRDIFRMFDTFLNPLLSCCRLPLSIYNSLTLYGKNQHQPFFTFWELCLLFRISWRGPHKNIAGFLFGRLKFGRCGDIWKKWAFYVNFFTLQSFFLNSELLSDSICPFSSCWVKSC